ncbi:MAG: DinB family protein [Cytophagales bacterium]|nr:DinB family protein [Cytophaga sp.]
MKYTSESTYKKIQLAAVSLILQLEDVIDTLKQEEYAQSLPILSNSSIGQHTRHIIEFFQCLYSIGNSGTINYDLRERNKQIETNSAFTKAVLTQILSYLEETPEDLPVNIAFNFSTEDDATIHTPSSLSRELAYNIEHCIHHMAIIKIGILYMLPQFQFPEHFGIAASTVKHQKTSVCVQ